MTFENNILTLEHTDKLIQQATEVRRTNISLSLKLSLEAISQSTDLNYKEGLAKANLSAGICSRLLSAYEDAFHYYNEALRLFKDLGDKKGESRALNSIGVTHMTLGEFPKAIEYYDESIYLLQCMGDFEFEAVVLSNKGLAYQQFGNLKLS